MTAQLGTVPTTAERVELLEQQLADALARIAALESARDVDDQVDGSAPTALPSPPWFPIKKAAALVGYSEPGLRKAIRRHAGGAKWWRYSGARLFVDIDRCPRRPVRT
jgi:hypothetical protein